MLPDAARGKPAVHSVITVIDEGGFPEEGVSLCRQDAHLLALCEDVTDVGIGCAAPFGTRTMPSVVADIEGLIALRGRRIMQGMEFVRMGVESRPLGKFLQESDHFGALLLRSGGQGCQEQGEKGQESFHVLVFSSKIGIITGISILFFRKFIFCFNPLIFLHL